MAAGVTLLLGAASGTRTYTVAVARGLIFRQILDTMPARIVNVADVDLRAPGVSVAPYLGHDDVEDETPTQGREAVSTLARRKGLAVAVNGDFFYRGAPVGVCVHDGELVTLPYPRRAALIITDSGSAAFTLPSATAEAVVGNRRMSLRSINLPRGPDSLVLYTPSYGPRTLTDNSGTEIVLGGMTRPLRPGRWDCRALEVHRRSGRTVLRPGLWVLSGAGVAAQALDAVRPGEPIGIDVRISAAGVTDWSRVRSAVGGGPFLVRGGAVSIDAANERFQPDVVDGRAPRTAVGIRGDGHLLLVTVDGRQPLSTGCTLAELAGLMVHLGCTTAMNLDGGGSTAMAVRGVRVNSPSDGYERSVAEIVGVRADEAGGDSVPSVHPYADLKGPVESGQSIQFEAKDDEGEPLTGVPGTVWGVEGGIGFTDQGGRFTARRAGSGRVVVRGGHEISTFSVEVVASRLPATLTSRWENDPEGHSTRLTLLVSDAAGNRIPGVPVQVAMPPGSGSVDSTSVTTDRNGSATFHLVWTRSVPRKLTVTARPIRLELQAPVPADLPGPVYVPSP